MRDPVLQRLVSHKTPLPRLLSFVALTGAIGCAQQTEIHSLPGPVSGAESDRGVLAGEWQYEDGAVVTLRLDRDGNGTYPWKDGRLETTHLTARTWVGKWYQRENDREGGFVVTLSPDYSEGEGRWWYTRIGSDRAPAQLGGTFRLSRRTSVSTLSDTPPAP